MWKEERDTLEEGGRHGGRGSGRQDAKLLRILQAQLFLDSHEKSFYIFACCLHLQSRILISNNVKGWDRHPYT